MLAWSNRPPLSATERDALHQEIDREYSVTAFGKRVAGLYDRLA
jgi:hypothetical protein